MSDLASRLDQFINRRVLCIGDLMIDNYVYGRVERISPEAPIPVLHQQSGKTTLGGAGNVVWNIATLGGTVAVIGVVGQDEAANTMAKQFKLSPGVTAHLVTDSSRPTTQKIRFVADRQQLLRVDDENAKPISANIEKQIIQMAANMLATVQVVILSDYAKGVLTPKITAETIRLSREADKIVIVDPKGRDFGRYRGATYLTPNRKELSDALGKPITTVTEAYIDNR